jgi:hypothetical protein
LQVKIIKGPEWDVVSQTLDEGCVLLGEVKWSERPVDLPKLRTLAKKLLLTGTNPASKSKHNHQQETEVKVQAA